METAAPMRLGSLPPLARFAIGAFVVLLLGFQVSAQANLWVQDGGGELPSSEDVLWKYHGRPSATKLHQVLDPALPQDSPRAMWPFLGDGPAEQAAARALVLGWVDAGAPRDRWPEVAEIFQGTLTCGQCHAPGGQKASLPFTTYEGVLVVAEPDRGMPWTDLLVSAHNHAFAFAVLALLLSLGTAFTPFLGRWRFVLVAGAFLGAALDVGSWFLTKRFGEPFHLGVVAGGGLFGATSAAMSALVLVEVLRDRRASRAIASAS
jgi:hypothetical protein